MLKQLLIKAYLLLGILLGVSCSNQFANIPIVEMAEG